MPPKKDKETKGYLGLNFAGNPDNIDYSRLSKTKTPNNQPVEVYIKNYVSFKIIIF